MRDEQRIARAQVWDTPVRGLGGHVRAWAHAVLFDQGLLRAVHLNKHRVTDEFWRSAQPLPHQLRRLESEGFKTIIKVRGGRGHASWQLEREACERLGLRLVELDIRSRNAPEHEVIYKAARIFGEIEYPALVHCKAGVDRTGFAAALYLILSKNRPVDEALAHLSGRYGHVKFSRTGILDAFFELYRDTGEARGIGLLDWVRDRYDPVALEKSFSSKTWANVLVDRLLRRE